MKRLRYGLFLGMLLAWGGLGPVRAMAAGEFCDAAGHGAGSASPEVNTALGCVPVQIEAFMVWLLPKLFGVAGGLSFLLMVYGFIETAMSGGDPKKAEAAKERITSAITGLLVSVFALFLLRLIAIDILQIPGMK